MTHRRRCVFSWCCCRSGPGGGPGFPGCRWCCKRWERSPQGDPLPLQVHGLSPTRNHLIPADLAADLAAAAPAVVDARASPSPPLCSSRFYGQCKQACSHLCVYIELLATVIKGFSCGFDRKFIGIKWRGNSWKGKNWRIILIERDCNKSLNNPR